jgi:hypothetical protein
MKKIMLLVRTFRIFLLIVTGWTRYSTALDENLFTIWNESSTSAPSIDFNTNSIQSNNDDDLIGPGNHPQPKQHYDSRNSNLDRIQNGHASFQNDSVLPPRIRSGMKQQQQQQQQQGQRHLLFHLFCVRTEEQLRNAVKNAATSGPTHTRINLCTRNLKISNPDNVDPMMISTGIDVSNKWIDLKCSKLFGRCTLDGQGLYGIIYGANTNLKMHRIDITNGRSYKFSLSAVGLLESKVQISQSTFRNNIGLYTSALLVSSDEDDLATSLTLQDVTFEHNNGYVSIR